MAPGPQCFHLPAWPLLWPPLHPPGFNAPPKGQACSRGRTTCCKAVSSCLASKWLRKGLQEAPAPKVSLQLFSEHRSSALSRLVSAWSSYRGHAPWERWGGGGSFRSQDGKYSCLSACHLHTAKDTAGPDHQPVRRIDRENRGERHTWLPSPVGL